MKPDQVQPVPKASEHPTEKPLVRTVAYDKKTIKLGQGEGYAPPAPAPGTELWTDVVVRDIDGFLGSISVCPVTEDHFIKDEEDRTVFQIPFLVRDSTRMQYLFVVCEGHDRITTIRGRSWPRDPVERTLSFIGDVVDEETDEGRLAIPNFRDFIFIALLGACAEEFIATLNVTRRRVNAIYKELIGASDPMAAQGEIYEVHSFLSEVFGTAVFLFRELVSMVARGSGRHLKLNQYQHFIEKVQNDVNQAIEMRESLENSLGLISNTVRASLSDQNIANTERLNRAVEILTRLSVLLMIPNSVFTLWPTMPINNQDIFLGLQSAAWELLLALALTVAGQVLISYYYKHSYLKALFGRGETAAARKKGPATPPQQT